MAMLKSLTSHVPCSVYIQTYLETREGRERALARDFGNIPNENKEAWAKFMDAEREWAGIYPGEYRGKGKTRTYQHFILSPDPKDGIGLETLRELAQEWAREFFGSELSVGEIGAMQWVIVYHDDNKSGIPHAHVIVNNLDVVTGKRMQITPKQNKALTNRLQGMAKAKGLSAFDYEEGTTERVKRPRTRSRAEIERLGRGLGSWKEDIATKAFVASYVCEDEDDYVKVLDETLGISVRENAEGDWVYMDKADELHRVSGAKLGREYTKPYVHDALMLQSPAAGFKEPMRGAISSLRTVADGQGLTVEQVAEVARTNIAFHITHPSRYGKLIAQLEAERRRTGEASVEWDELTAQIEALQRARDAVEMGYLFDESGRLELANRQGGGEQKPAPGYGEATSSRRKSRGPQQPGAGDAPDAPRFRGR